MIVQQSTMGTALLCINCKHYKENPNGKWSSEIHECYYYAEPTIDLVTGDTEIGKPESAYVIRSGRCGVNGTLYEPK